MPEYRATEYLRLSYSNDREIESDSISNQKKLIEEYLKSHPDIELVSQRVDDGYSGILFDRPAFQEMMQDIIDGKINCVIVKDLSRLGREYIETGRYLRRVFPAYGVRFIAITDGIDTADEKAGDDLNISMKNIINDAYCHDISVKTRSALEIKRKNGDYVGACPVYGYKKSEENHNRLAVDETAARVVKRIYRRKIEGASAKKIADELNRLGVLSPLAYKIRNNLPHPTGGYADSADAKWSATTVIRILNDETYTGILIQGRRGTHNHKIKDVVDRPKEEWVCINNAHEAVISRQEYDLVKSIMRLDTRTAPGEEKVYLFSGILICGCCGGSMTRKTNHYKGKKYFYYYCPTGKKNGCSHPAMLREDILKDCVLGSLQSHINNIISLEELLDSINEERINKGLLEEYETQIKENQAQIEQTMQFKSTLYENFIKGLLDKEEYKALKDNYTEHLAQLREAIGELEKEMEDVKCGCSDRVKWIQQFKRFSSIKELDRRAVVALIQSVQIMSKTEIKITFRYQMEYEKTLDNLKLYGSVGKERKMAETVIMPDKTEQVIDRELSRFGNYTDVDICFSEC